MAHLWGLGRVARRDGPAAQLAVNLAGIFIAAVSTLYIQRRLYRRRLVEHLSDGAREAAGLPMGRSRRA